MALNIKTQQVGLEESVNDVVNRINRRGINVKIGASDFTQPLGRITRSADEFTKSLEASNARVIAFGASAAIIGGVTRGFVELVEQAVKVEKILTDINVVLGTSESNLAKFGTQLFQVARNTSQALDTAAEAALEFSRQGLSMEETLRRTTDALILTRLTGIDAAAAVSGLTAAVNGFADAGLTTTEIINKLAAVDVKFAVSADDLIDALARAGAVAQDAGVNFDQLVGAVTSAQQITARGGAVIGNSFKTIFTRIQRSSTLNRLEELGVAVRDVYGSTLPAVTVLTNLSKAYDTLGSTTKAAVAEQVGGVFQINILKAALKDLNKENSLYAQATAISNSATDEAQRKNEQLQQTLSSLAKQTSLTFQELAANIGELALSPGLSNLLEAFNDVASTLNNLFGEDSEGIGADFAKGIVRGIGNVITGPGLVLAFGVFAKLFSNALKFAKSSLKDVLGIVTAKDKERAIQESIVMAMSQNKQLAIELNKYSNNKVKQEEIMLGLIKEQTRFLMQQQKLASSLAPGLARKGVSADLTLPKNKAEGFVPNFSKPSMMESLSEQSGARNAGYAPGNVKSMSIPKIGRVVYNDAETVRQFPGMEQPAIMPPRSSKAGQKYKNDFQGSHGFDPYANGGLIPNFSFRGSSGNVRAKRAFTYDKTGQKQWYNQLSGKANDIQNFLKWVRSNKKLPPRQIQILESQFSSSSKAYSQSYWDTYNKVKSGQGNRSERAIMYGTRSTRPTPLPGKENMSFNITDPSTKLFIKNDKMKGLVSEWKSMSNVKESGLFNFSGFIPNFIDSRTRSQKIKDVLSDPANKNIKFNKPTKKIIKSKNMWDQEILRMYQENPRQDYLGKPLIDYLTQKGYDRKQLQALARRPSDFKIMSDGFIPNFALQARQQGNVLYLPKARMVAQTSDSKFNASGYKKIQSSINSLMREAPSYSSVFSELKKLGINEIARTIYFTNQDSVRKAGRSAYRAASKQKTPQKRAEVGGKVYEEKLNKILKLKGYKSTSKHPTANVDFIAPGRIPIEAKYSSVQKDSLMAKSLKIFGDKSLENFLKQNQAPDLAAQLSEKKLESALNIANKVWKKGSTLEDVQLLRLNQGFVPNFVNENVLQKQKLIIKDGDSVEGRVAIAPPSIDHRLSGVDAIEKYQPLGEEATQLAIDSYKGKAGIDRLQRTRVPGGQAAYGRGLFNDDDLARNLVRKGLGIPDLRYVGRAQYATELQEAKSNQRGIWHWKHAATKSRRAHPKREFYNHQTGTVEKLSSLTTGKKGKRRFSDEDIAIIEREGLSGLKGRGRGVKIKEGMNRLNYQGKNAFDGFVPNFVFKSIMGKMKAVPGKIKNVLRSGESKFLQSWGLTKDPVKYLRDLGMDQSTALRVSKMPPKDIYAKIKKESEALEMARVDRSVSQYIEGIGSRTRSPFYSDNPEVTRIAEQVSSRYHNGFIPNFVNPLAQAIKREEGAGVPRSQIKIERDNSLVSRSNPMGLAVTNTRDEPLGVRQGIERARAMGIDPKTHGASSGFVPNFNTPQIDFNKLSPLSNESKKAGDHIKNLGNSAKSAADSSGGLMMGMFALTSMTYALEGAIGDAESGFAKFSKVTNSAIMGVSQSSMIYSGLNQVAQQQIDKGTNMGKVLGRVAKGAGILGAVVGTAIPVFQALKENTDWFDSGLDTLRKSASKTAKGIDALGTAISSAEGIEDTRKELTELNTSAMAGTYQGEMQRLKLNAQLIKQQSELAAQSGKLGKQLNLTESEIKAMTDGTASGMKKLQEAMLQAQQQMAVTGAMQGFIASQSKDANPIDQELAKLNLAQISSASSKSVEDLRKSYESALNVFSKQNIDTYNAAPTFKPQHEIQVGGGGSGDMFGNITTKSIDAIKTQEDIQKELLDQVANSKEINMATKMQINAAIKSGKSLSEISGILNDTKNISLGLKGSTEQQTKESEGALEISRQIKKARQETLNSMELGKIDYSIEQNLAKLNQSHMMQEMSYRAKLNDSLGILSNSASIDLELKNREQQIQNDYINQKSAINRETVEAQQKLIKDLFAGGGSFKPEEMFADFNKEFKQKDKTITIASSSTDSGINNENPMGPTNNQRALTRTIKGETFEAGKKEAVEGNINKIIKDLESGSKDYETVNSEMKKLAERLRNANVVKDESGNVKKDNSGKTQYTPVVNDDQARQITLEYLSNLDEAKQIAAIRVLQEKGIISKTADIESVIQKILDTEETKLEGLSEEKKQKRKNLALVTKELNLGKQTAAAAQERLTAYSEILTSEKGLRGSIQEQLQEVLDFNIMQASMNKHIGENTRSILMSEGHRSQLALSMQSIMEGELTNEVQSLVNQEARLEAEKELRKNTELYSQMMAIKAKTAVGKSIIGMQDSAQLDSKTLEEEKKQKKFAIEAETNLTKAKNAADRDQLAFNEKLKAGGFQLDALHEMANAARDFTAEMIKIKAKIANNEFFKEGERSVERDKEMSEANLQKAQGKVSATEGNTILNTQARKEEAVAQKEKNIAFGEDSLFSDTLAVRIAETNEQLARFSETMANTTFDAVQDGFRTMVKDMAKGTKSLGDAALSFVGTIAERIQNKLLEQAADSISNSLMKGLFENKNQGGLIQGFQSGGSVGAPIQKYASGGSTQQVPAMLTAGEYVVRKKIVDRLGKDHLEKINKHGSLEDLYEQPNEDMIDITSESAATIPSIIRANEGGHIDRYLMQRNRGDDRISMNERSVVDGDQIINDFTNTVEKFTGGIMKLAQGGSVHNSNRIPAFTQNLKDGGMSGDTATGLILGSTLYGMSQYEPSKGTDPPEPPASMGKSRLNTRSILDIDTQSKDGISKMSSRYKNENKDYQERMQYEYDMDEWRKAERSRLVKERADKIQGAIDKVSGALDAAMINQFAQAASGIIDNKISDFKNRDKQFSKLMDVSSPQDKKLDPQTKTTQSIASQQTSVENPKFKEYQDRGRSIPTPPNIDPGTQTADSKILKSMVQAQSKNVNINDDTHQYNWSTQRFEKKHEGGIVSHFNTGGAVQNKSNQSLHKYQYGGTVNNNPSTRNSNHSSANHFNTGGAVQNKSNQSLHKYQYGGTVNNNPSTRNSNHSSANHFNTGGAVQNITNNNFFNQGGQAGVNYARSYSHFNQGGEINKNITQSIQRTSQQFSGGGKVRGPAGIDKVGPIMLDKGEYVIKASSVNKVEKQYPGFFDRLNASKMNQGGEVGKSNVAPMTAADLESTASNSSSSNVTVNIHINSNGEASSSGGDASQQAFGGKIKEAVLGVIASEKRVGGSLRGK